MNQRNNTYYPVLRSAALALGGGIAFSWPLWQAAARSTGLPTTPLFTAFTMSNAVDTALLFILLSGLIWTVWQPQKLFVRWMIIGALMLMAASDLSRCQPWVWLFFLVFLIDLPVFSSKIKTLRWLLASVYIWSGAYKISPWFAVDNFEWFCSAFEWTKPLGNTSSVGYFLAVAEMLMGVALLVPRWAMRARWGLIVMHAVIVVFLLKLSWNPVVVPWNLGMMALLFFLKNESENTEKWPIANRIFAASVLLLPALNIAGWWPRTFSWHLYDNTQSEVVFFTENAQFDEPFQTEIWSKYAYDRQRQLLLDDWAIHELHVPLPDVAQVAENVGQNLCQRIKTGENAGWSVLRVQQFCREQVVTDTIMCHSNQ